MYYVYIVKSSIAEHYYIGSCKDTEKRLRDHNANRVRSTKRRGPWTLVHQEPFENKTDALYREKQIKSYKGGRFFKKLIVSSPSSSLA